MAQTGTRSSSSSCLTEEEKAVAEFFADAECERIRPRNRDAYRATVLARKSAELIANRAAIAGLRTQFVQSGMDVLVAQDEAADGWSADPDQRRAARERGLLLARLEAEQGKDPSW